MFFIRRMAAINARPTGRRMTGRGADGQVTVEEMDDGTWRTHAPGMCRVAMDEATAIADYRQLILGQDRA